MSRFAGSARRQAGWFGRMRVTVGVIVLLGMGSAAPASAQGALAHAQGPNLGTWLTGRVELALAATGGGGNGTYVWTLAPGSNPLPPGLSVVTEVPSYFAANANAGLIGVPTATGTFTFTLRLGSLGELVDRTYTLRITSLTVKEQSLPHAFVGKPFSYQLSVLNAQGPVTFAQTSAPAGWTISSSGLMTGTPGAPGFSLVCFTVTDGVDTTGHCRGASAFAVEIVTDGVLPNATSGQPYSATILAAGGSGPYTFVNCATASAACVPGVSGLPAGLTLSTTGVISGVPSVTGKYSLDITAVDAGNVSYTKRFAIAVASAPEVLPNISPYSSTFDDCTLGVDCTQGLFVGGGSGAPYSWAATGLPLGMSIRTIGADSPGWTPGDGQIYGTPSMPGNYSVEITVTDRNGHTATNTYPLRVAVLQLVDFLPDGTINTPYSRRLRVIGGQRHAVGAAYTTTQILSRLPFGLSLDPATMTVAGTPLENSQFNFSFDPLFQFTDAAGNVLRRRNYFAINTTGSSITFNTGADLGSRTTNVSTSASLSACCAPALTFAHVGGTLPPGMTLSSGGVLSGTPTISGIYNFLVSAADAANPSNVGLRGFTLVVTSLNISANIFPSIANVGSSISFSMAPTGGTGAITFSLPLGSFTPPGLLLNPSTGELSGTLTKSGLFNFSVEARDGSGATVTRFFSLAAYPAGVNPPLNLIGVPNVTRGLGVLLQQLTTTGGVPPYTYSMTPGAPLIPGMRVQNGQPLPTNFTATGGYIGVLAEPGVFNSSLRVTDSTGEFFDRAFTLIIPTVHHVSIGPPPRGTLGEPYSFQLAGQGPGTHVWSLTPLSNPLPPGLSIDPNGLVSGTPTTAGSFNFVLQLTSALTGEFLQTSYTIVVNPFAISPKVLPAATVGVPYSQALNAPGCGAGCTWTPAANINGLSFSADGVLSGTPTGANNAVFTATATGPGGTSAQAVTVQILANTPQPVFINQTIAPSVIGSLVGVRLTAQGGIAPYSWVLESGTLPPGLSLFSSGDAVGSLLSPGDSYLAGKPIQVGTYGFTLKVMDALGGTHSKTFSWEITPLSFQYFNLPVSGPLIDNPLVYDSPYSQKLLVLGGSGNYSFVNTSAMPPGLTLATDGTVSGTPTNTGLISPSTAVQVTDDAGHINTANINFTVAGPTSTVLGFSSNANLGTFQQGFTQTFNVTPTGGTGFYIVNLLSPLPAGFALMSGDALLSGQGGFFVSGTPLAAGPFSFTVRAEDSAGNIGVRTFTGAFVPFVRASSGTLPDATRNAAYSHNILTFGTTSVVTWSLQPGSAMPPGLNLAGNGLITGTPTVAGNYSFVLAAIDSSNVPLAFTFTLRVASVTISEPPVLAQQAISGQELAYQLQGTPGAVWSITNPPAGFSVSPGGLLTVNTTSSGFFVLNLSVTDGVLSFSRRITVVVRLPNPSVLDSSITQTALADVTVGQSMTTTLNNSGGRPPYQWSVAPGSSLPPGLQLIPIQLDLSQSFTPGGTLLAGIPTTIGQYTFDLELRDSVNAITRRTFTLNVTPLNIPNTQPRAAITGLFYSQQFTATGATGGVTFSISPTSFTQDALPPGLSMSPSGLLSGTTASSGNYAFRLMATDATGKTFARNLTLLVNSPSGLRVLSNNPPDTWVGRGRNGLVLSATPASGTAPSTYSWSLVGGALPPGVGIVSTDLTTTQLWGPATTPGVYTFTLRATDIAAPAVTADHTFTYRIAPMQVVAPPVQYLTLSDLPSGNVAVPYSFAIKMAGGSGAYTFGVSPFNPLPPGLSLSAAGVLSGTPQATGSFGIAPILSDGTHTIAPGSLTLIIAANGGVEPMVRSGVTNILDAAVGTPVLDNLIDFKALFRGGLPPFTMTLGDGTSLPPGVKVLPGANGQSPRTGGVPTAAGAYSYSLLVNDSSGQSLVLPVSQNVSPLSLSPASLPPGMVGVFYSQTLTFSGGIAPYTLLLTAGGGGSDMPPGLSLNSAGLLSGTPTAPGNFRLNLRLSDGSGASLTVFYYLTIDNAAGQAPALNVTPLSVERLHQTGSPAPAPVNISVQTTSANLPFTATVRGIPGATLSATAGTTPAVIALNLPSLAAGVYNGLVVVQAPSSANIVNLVPVTLTSAPPPPCSFTLNPPGASIPSAGGSGSFQVETTCAWTATVPPGTVVAVTNAKGTGAGTVSYTLPANSTAGTRSVNIGVGDQFHTITQFGTACAFALSPGRFSAPASGGEATVGITASVNDDACTWGVTSATLAASPANGTWRDQTVTLIVPPNLNAAPRVLTANIGGRTLTVNQAGAACGVSLSPYSVSAPANGGDGSVAVATPAGCAYETNPGPSWISVTSGGSGSASGTLFYSVLPNTTAVARVGSLSIGGQTFTVTQEGLPCSVTIDTAGLGNPFGANGGAGVIGINANGPNCAWNAASALPWASVTPPTGTGNGSVGVTVLSNATSIDARSGFITMAGQQVRVDQAGTACTFSLLSPSGTVPPLGGSGAVGVLAPAACTWAAESTDASWLTITASANRASGEVRFSATANPSVDPRVAMLKIAGLEYVVTQAGAPCPYVFALPGLAVASARTSTSVDFSTSTAGCVPAPQSYVGWLTIDDTTFDGGNGTIRFTVEANPTVAPRSGAIRLGDRLFTVTQLGGACGFSLGAYSAGFAAPGGSADVNGSPSAVGCLPNVSADQPFITLGALTNPGVNLFRLHFSVAPFSSLTSAIRLGKVTFGGQIVTVKQTSY